MTIHMERLKVFYQRALRFHKRVANVLAHILLTLVYFTLVLPYGLLMRLHGKQSSDSDSTFWIAAPPPAADMETMQRQF